MHVELYNLADDAGEQQDLVSSQPDLVNELRERLHQWRSSVGAQMPIPNRSFDPTKPEYIPPPPKRK